jgi:hypothetical protein
MGRPALAPRPQPKPERKPEPSKAERKAAKKARKAGRMMDGGKHRRAVDQLHDPWANVPPEQRRKKVMNLDQWLRDRKNSGDRY